MKFKEICFPLLKKPVSCEGKLELKIASLPPLFNRNKNRTRQFENNDAQIDGNWIALENF